MSQNDLNVIEEVVIGENGMEPCREKVDVEVSSISSSDRYRQDNVIGNGAYGTVYLAHNMINGNRVAMKKITLPNQGGIPMSTLREITMLKKTDRFNHPNIIKLLDVCHSMRRTVENRVYMVYEHVEQDLASYLEKAPDSGLPESSIKRIIHQTISGIAFLHSSGALHRDLKPQNILITNDEVVKLADFGLAKSVFTDSRLTTVVVTLWYRSPEILLNVEYSSPVDVWSIGCIMAEMYRLKPLFMGSSEGDQLDKIFDVLGSPDVSEWPSEVLDYTQFSGRKSKPFESVIPNLNELAKDFLGRMLAFNPAKRIRAKEALNHPYLSDSDYTPPSIEC